MSVQPAMPRSGGLTLELKGKTSPERLIAEIRRQAPHLLDEMPPPRAQGAAGEG